MSIQGVKIFALLLWTFWSNCTVVSTLKNVRFVASEAVKAGDAMRLQCDYDLEGALLYSIKWYFNSNEFYRYVPKESPPTRVFPKDGITVDMSQSDNKSVTLRSVGRQLTGYYECEISADAPLFHTVIKRALINVVEKPEAPPNLYSEKLKYSEGEIIKANCTSRRSYPAANLTWFINNQKITTSSDKKLKIVKYPESVVLTNVVIGGIGSDSGGGDGEKALENTISKLELLATSDVFSKGKLTLACEATQFSLYRKRTEIKLSEDAPQLAHVLSPTTRNYSGKTNCNILHWFTLCTVLGQFYLYR